VLLFLSNAMVGYSQTAPQDESRGFKPREYAQNLPQQIAAKRRKKNPDQIQKSNPKQFNVTQTARYKAVDTDESKMEPGTAVGFTFWRLTPATSNDDPTVAENKRIAVRKKDKVVEENVSMVPKRAESGTEFADGDEIRFSLELPMEGYIYLFDQEQYVDGSLSDPYLIFPSRMDIGKTDRIVSGKLLFVPNETGSFILERYVTGKPEKVAEVITLLISPQPIKDLPVLETEEPRKIEKQKFEQWVKEWGGPAWKFEQQRSVGLPITKAEKNANVAGGQLLSENDNLPQTIYHVAHQPGRPFLFTIPIKIHK
jgi:hypothetical protein